MKFSDSKENFSIIMLIFLQKKNNVQEKKSEKG